MHQPNNTAKETKAPRNFKELRAKMSPERRARNDSETAKMLAEMPLHALREARRMTQENLAQVLGVKQASISKLENRTDMYVGTLARFIEAMGGTLEIRASFPDGTAVRITQFADEEDAA
jgi:DNA-binding XRE family transcriptional regulator